MNPWKIISDQEVETIHEASLQVLSEVGIVLDHPQIREQLADAGASFNGDRVQLPPDLVEKSIEISTKKVSIRGGAGKIITLSDGSLHWHNLGEARDIYDPVNGKIRRVTLQDLQDSTPLLDALDQVTTIIPFFTPTDVPGQLMSLVMYRHALPLTNKSLQGPGVQTGQEVKIPQQINTK